MYIYYVYYMYNEKKSIIIYILYLPPPHARMQKSQHQNYIL